jgi:hypothetical protein
VTGVGVRAMWAVMVPSAMSSYEDLLDRYAGERLTDRSGLTSEQCDVCHPMGVIGFDVDRHSRRSGPRTQGYLVNDPCKLIGADSNRTDFALAA